ncbi:TetR/AcrR family transcriptional regulator [Mycetocola zhadangensis]|uniref:TetR/AcrR family transcriptional regulator n=1 Tax=Mycetocola zhadangensis TaxID=1164595 RepID=A0A3L7ISV5_9MICO|nr:TetR/AcrR family transcriptional regulator [Mycetocola zhadangensis]RLQ81314.1 TetR/AcrR family transcriptional regulator [Mycetocola zhadangensis]GGF02832.1 putative transcriptional regulator, TetR family protein [Mycetocola zhadangensis]
MVHDATVTSSATAPTGPDERIGRTEAKARRREALLDAASRHFAERGFNGVSIEDLGTAVGMSGPAVYRHFESKHALLAAVLVGVSQNLLDGGTRVVSRAPDGELALRALIEFHVRFALDNADVIRVQDRDLDSLSGDERHTVRTLQRRYVEVWVGVLQYLHPQTDVTELRIRAHAAFGLINSTPYSGQGGVQREAVRRILEEMAFAGLR